MKLWPELREMNVLEETLSDERAVKYWRGLFDRAYAEHEFADYWDYQWTFSCWAQSGLSVIPNASMITNIGCGPEGTHTKWQGNPHANIKLEPIALPLKHPEFVAVNREADQLFVDSILGSRSKAKVSQCRDISDT